MSPSSAPPGTGPWRPLFAAATAQAVLHHVEGSLDPRSLLSPAELGRSTALARPRDREDFLAARVLVRLLLRSALAPDTDLATLDRFALTQQCPRCGGPHGRPVVDLPGVAVSWAHSGGYVAAALGPGSVGVDVEPGDAATGHVPASATTRSWVRSEAIVKWGHGDVDAALAWQSRLQGRTAPRGRRYALAADGTPRPARLPWNGPTGHVVLTDAPAGDRSFVSSVAAASRARWAELLSA